MFRQKRLSVLPVAAFSACLLFVGCAAPKKPATNAWPQDKTLVLQSIETLQQQQLQLANSLKTLQQQVTGLQTDARQKQASDAAQQEGIDKIKREIRRLQLATTRLKKSRRISKQKLDKKIEKIAQAIKPPEPVDQMANGEEEKDRYTAAYLALKSGRYDEAIEKFRVLLKDHPKGQYSDQAYYWLGESYLALNNTGRAIGNFEWLVSHFPDSTKQPVAMLKLGLAYQSQERFEEAKSIWQKLIARHADSPAAEKARKLLQSADTRQNAR